MDKRVPEVRFKGFTDDWEQHSLKNVLHVNSGKDYKGLNIGNIPVYGTGGYMTSVDGKLSDTDSIGLGRKGTIDKPFLLKAPFWTVDTLFFLTPLKRFNLHFLFSVVQKYNWKKLNEATGVPSLSKKTIENVDQFFPILDEQVEIGLLISKIDNSIVLYQKKLSLYKKIKQSLLQTMFPRDGEKIPEVRFTYFHDDWELCKLGDHAIIKGRLGWKSLKQDEYIDKGPSMIAGKHIYEGKINWNKVDHIPLWRYEESPEIMLKDGDLIFSKDGSLGNPALITGLKNKATINATMMLVRTDYSIDSSFLYQILLSSSFEHLIHLKVSGSSIPHLFQADMNKFVFHMPVSQGEQELVSSLLKRLDNLITLQQQKLLLYKDIKKFYLQKLFI